MKRLFELISASYRQKIILLASIPLVLAVAAIGLLVADQSRQLSDREIAGLENQLIEAKRAELRNYISLARTAIVETYGPALPTDETAKLRVSQVLSSMIYGQDGYFFVFDYDGNNLVAPRQTYLINRNWSGLADSNGVDITDTLIEKARFGGGYHEFHWLKPTTGEEAPMIAYVISLPDWRWVLGTGIFVDDIRNSVAVARADVETRIRQTFFWIGGITLIALVVVYLTGLFINMRERRLADAKLQELTQRIIDTQEEERGRVARELHDGISQILVGVRYALELAARQLAPGRGAATASLQKGMESLSTAIQEVRRISQGLRPGILDDLGLAPALTVLTDDFSDRTGIRTELETVVFRNRISTEAKIALFRIAQEAMTNIERHAGASEVKVKVWGHRKGATMRIQDNGIGAASGNGPKSEPTGLGLRNMQERIEILGGNFRILSSSTGTVIEAEVPLSQMLPPEAARKASA